MNTVEFRAAETLLDRGVAVHFPAPLLLRLFGKKRITVKIQSPMGGTLVQISSYYLQLGLDVAKVNEIPFNELVGKQLRHTKTIAKLVACALLNDRLLSLLFTPLLAFYLMNKLTLRAMCTVMEIVILQGGIEDFTHIISLGQTLNMMKPKVSQQISHTS